MSARGAADEPADRPTPDGRVLAALYGEHAPALLAFVRRYADPSTAEDVVQETFLRAWARVDLLDADRNPRAYLMTTARNLLTDRWRRERAHPVVGLPDGHDAADPDGDPDEVLAALLVAEALRRLTREHRAVVQLLFFDGWTVAQAATLLGIPAGTVKSRSYYALRALRAALDELGVTR